MTSQRAKAKARTSGGAGVDGDVLVAGEGHGERACASGVSDEEAGNAAESRENDTLGEELADDAGARGAKGGAEGHFRFAAHAADEEEIGDVGAGDEEDESGDPHEHVEVGFVLSWRPECRRRRGEDDVSFGEGSLARGRQRWESEATIGGRRRRLWPAAGASATPGLTRPTM